MAIMNWPERTKDSKTFNVVSKKAKQRQILSVSSLKYQIIPHLSVRGYNLLPSKGGSLKVTTGGIISEEWRQKP